MRGGRSVRASGNFLAAANWPSDVGYAWWLMENFWVQISHLAEARGAVCHLAFPEITTLPQSIAESGIVPVELSFPGQDARSLKASLDYVRDHGIRYVYLTDRPFRSVAYAALRAAGVRRIVVHDHAPGHRSPSTGLRGALKATLHQIPVITADAMIAVTPFVQQRHLICDRIPPPKSHLARNGIVPTGRDPSLAGLATELFGIPRDARIIFAASRAHRYKRVDFLIRCAHRLVHGDGREDVYIIFCGDGPHLQEFRSLARQLDVVDHFIFAGRRSDVSRIAQSCHIGTQVSFGEVGYSLSILEFMSAGLPVVVPDNESVCGAVRHGETGLVFREGDVESACDAYRALLDDDDVRREMGEAACRCVREEYRLDETNRQLLRIVDAVCR